MLNKKSEEIDLAASTDIDYIKTEFAATTAPTLPKIEHRSSDIDNEIFYLTYNNQQGNGNLMSESNMNGKYVNFTHEKTQYDGLMNKNTICKSKSKPGSLDRQKNLFNKLYRLDTIYTDNCKKAKRLKYMTLEKYQNNLLNVMSSHQIDQQNFINLSNKFKELRTDAEFVTPLPPVDFNIIREKTKNKSKINVKKLTMKQYFANINQKGSEDDEINQVRFKYKSKVKPYNNKVFNNLPPYLLETLQKKMKLHL